MRNKQKHLLVLQTSIEFSETHEFTQFLKQDLDEDSTR